MELPIGILKKVFSSDKDIDSLAVTTSFFCDLKYRSHITREAALGKLIASLA